MIGLYMNAAMIYRAQMSTRSIGFISLLSDKCILYSIFFLLLKFLALEGVTILNTVRKGSVIYQEWTVYIEMIREWSISDPSTGYYMSLVHPS